MKAVRGKNVDPSVFANHRKGDHDFRRLLAGDEGAPNNYAWSIVRFGHDYTTPRHRHNFSQIHYVLEGTHEWAPDRPMEEGTITYQPEGVRYGPQHGRNALILGLQYGEASGAGFMSYDQLTRGNQELADQGTFEDGVYKSTDADGRRVQKDGYEAIWEHINGRPIEYPATRYSTPVTIVPDAFEWVRDPAEPGLARKHFGTFSERGTTIEFIQLDQGTTLHLRDLAGPQLHFVLDGSIACAGDSFDEWSAFEFGPDDDVKIEALELTTLYAIQLPVFG